MGTSGSKRFRAKDETRASSSPQHLGTGGGGGIGPVAHAHDDDVRAFSDDDETRSSTAVSSPYPDFRNPLTAGKGVGGGGRPSPYAGAMMHHSPLRRTTTEAFVYNPPPRMSVAGPSESSDGPVARRSNSVDESSSSLDNTAKSNVTNAVRSLSLVSVDSTGMLGTAVTSATSNQAGGGGGGSGGMALFSHRLSFDTPSAFTGTAYGGGSGGRTSILRSPRRQRGGRVRLPSVSSTNETAKKFQVASSRKSLNTSSSMFLGRSVSPSMSCTSNTSSIASFAFRSVIPFDFLQNTKLKRDRYCEAELLAHHASLRRSVVVVRGDNSFMTSMSKLQTSSLLSTSSAGTAGQRRKIPMQQLAQAHTKMPIELPDAHRGPVLVIGDCGEDIVAVLMVLAAMESYAVAEHGRLLCSLFSQVIATGTGAYVALTLAQGETINSLIDMLLQHDTSFLRSREKDAASPFHEDGQQTIETIIRLRAAEGERIEDNDDGNPRRLRHRYRRGDYTVTQPSILVSDRARKNVELIECCSGIPMHRLYCIAADCTCTLAEQQEDKRDEAVSVSGRILKDPVMHALTMKPRPTVVCRISLTESAADDDEEDPNTSAVAKEFRADFIDIALPTLDGGAASNLQPNSGDRGGGGAAPNSSSKKDKKNSLVPNSSVPQSSQSLALETYSPMESLLANWNLDGEGKQRRVHIMNQTEAFIAEIEGSLQRATDYIVLKAPKPRVDVRTPTENLVDDFDFFGSALGPTGSSEWL